MRNALSEEVQPLERRAELIAVNDNVPKGRGRLEPRPQLYRQPIAIFYAFGACAAVATLALMQLLKVLQ